MNRKDAGTTGAAAARTTAQVTLEAFEAWLARHGSSAYEGRNRVEIWRAGAAWALEEAAKACESTGAYRDEIEMAQECAAAVRALKEGLKP